MTNSKALRRPKIVAITGSSKDQKYNSAAAKRTALSAAFSPGKNEARQQAHSRMRKRKPAAERKNMTILLYLWDKIY